MSSSHSLRSRAVRCTALLAVAMGATIAAHGTDSTLVLGRKERWADMAVLHGIGTSIGRWGELDLVLSDAAYEAEADTDLLLHFDEAPFRDAAGRYDVVSADPQLSSRERALGTGSAAFVTPRGALYLSARAGSLLSPGSMWQDFSLEFWLYPASLNDGQTLLSWSGRRIEDRAVVEQSMSCTVARRRLVFRFENLFGAERTRVLELRGTTALVPRQWHHHLLRFDARTGLLEYLVDNMPEAVAYATDTGRDGGSIALPVVGAASSDPLVIGGGIQACVDELRLSRRFVEEPQLTRLRGETGLAVSRIFDLGLTGTAVARIESVSDKPEDTEIYYFYRMADRLRSRGELETEWTQFRPGSTGLAARGRYLQIMVELFPDGRLAHSPSVSSITVHYEPNLAPAPPAKLLATARNGSVRLVWSKVNETDVAGYRIYFGTRPGTYERILDVGNVTEYELQALENGRLYYFTVASYDTADTSRRSAFAPEVSARPSRLD